MIRGLIENEDLRTAMAERGTALTWDESVITYLAEKGYSAAYGARNLQRLIQKDVEDACISIRS